MYASRIALSVLSLVALASASPAPIDEKLQPVIAAKNNLGLVNPPAQTSSALSMSVSLSSVVVVAGAVVAML